MKRNVLFATTFLLYVTSIKPMELAPNRTIEDVLVINIVAQTAVRNDNLESRIKDLRNFLCVSKSWNVVIKKHIQLIIELLASTIQFDEIKEKDRCEVSKVAAAIELGSKASRDWLTLEYKNEKSYKELLFKLVKYPGTIQYISKLQYTNSFCNRIANEQTDALLLEIEKVKIPKDLSALILNTRKLQYEKITMDHDATLKLSLSETMDTAFKLLLLKRLVKENVECLNTYMRDIGHLFWCHAVDTQELPFLKEMLRYAVKLENCMTQGHYLYFQHCHDCYGITPLEKIIMKNRADLATEVLNCQDISGNEGQMHPLILGLKLGCWEIVKQLITHAACNINVIYNDETPLIICIKNNYLEMAALLMAQPRCDINKTGKHTRTPFMFAVLNGNSYVVDLLLKRPDILLDEKDEDGHTAYDIAVDLGYDEIAEKIKKMQNPVQQPVEHLSHLSCCRCVIL